MSDRRGLMKDGATEEELRERIRNLGQRIAVTTNHDPAAVAWMRGVGALTAVEGDLRMLVGKWLAAPAQVQRRTIGRDLDQAADALHSVVAAHAGAFARACTGRRTRGAAAVGLRMAFLEFAYSVAPRGTFGHVVVGARDLSDLPLTLTIILLEEGRVEYLLDAAFDRGMVPIAAAAATAGPAARAILAPRLPDDPDVSRRVSDAYSPITTNSGFKRVTVEPSRDPRHFPW